IVDTVFKGKIFVAECHFFTNHRSFPKSWQILICRSTTTSEKNSLFIKRSFIAAKNGYKDYLFCIANVEYIDFQIKYNLAMNHHILDQFAENIHPTNGLDSESTKILYSEICDHATCVTSNMSGQGKTEWIKCSSFKSRKAPRTLVISDSINFGTLVQQLTNCKLNTFESLHLDITLITYPHEIDFFLFVLLTLGIFSNELD
ncbi:24048_t:CDS:2, partial [Gigaspora rosea]